MKECWSEGELRAWLDRELAPDETERLEAHLPACPECSRAAAALERRAKLVSSLMSDLPDSTPAPARAARPRSAVVSWRWAAAAAALAAGLAIGALVVPKPPADVPRTASPANPRSAAAAGVPSQEPGAEPAEVADLTGPLPAKRAPRFQNFLRLDNESFETGVVVRVALGPNGVPADVIVGTDGRAHAIRLVNLK